MSHGEPRRAAPAGSAAAPAGAGEADAASLPLVVDLDGTLVATDTLQECLVACVAREPWALLRAPAWLLRGRAAVKQELARRALPDIATLPLRAPVLEYVREARSAGRRTVLATAADGRVAEAVAARLGVFDEVRATADGHNLKGARKRDALVAAFGERGFEYVGDSRADEPVWAAAARASLVGLPAAAAARVAARTPLGRRFEAPGPTLRTWVRTLRSHQWVKNVLVFLPMVMAHRLSEPDVWVQALLAFVALSLCASAIYVANDLADLPSDRLHPRKRHRPFAAGRMPLWVGLLLSPLLLAAGFALAGALLPPAFVVVLGVYATLSMTYSFALKRVVIVDVILLAGFYCLRVLAGGLATGIAVSPWLIGFSLFFFLSLGFLKRYAELRLLDGTGRDAAGGRGYAVGDAPLLLAVGPAAGILAALVLALYVQGDHVATLYGRPVVLWLLVPLLVFWVARAWLLAQRGTMVDDPVLFTVRDRASWAVGALAAGILAIAAL